MSGATEGADTQRHRFHEDALALVTGTAFVALGLAFYTEARLLTGSAAGLSLLLAYATGWGFGPIFSAVNLPFYALALWRMGVPFTIRTFAAVTLVSILAQLTPRWIELARIEPLYAAILGGALMGMGLLVLFRHRAGLGGFSILALYVQDTRGLRAGYFQMAVDGVILAASTLVVEFQQVTLSLIGAATLNLIIAMNHRPGRYVGVS